MIARNSGSARDGRTPTKLDDILGPTENVGSNFPPQGTTVDQVDKLAEVQAHDALAASKKIQPILSELSEAAQGAVLADLVSLWLAGHSPELRARALDDWLAVVGLMFPVSVQEVAARCKTFLSKETNR